MNFYTNNILTAVGNYRILTFTTAFESALSITNVTDVVTGGVFGSAVQRSFRYSTDGVSWSLWIDFTTTDQTPVTGLTFDSADDLYIEFKYAAISNPDESPSLVAGETIDPPFVIASVDVTLTYDTTVADPYIGYSNPCRCSDEFCTVPVLKTDCFSFDPYKVNSALCLYKELSSMTNQLFGHEVMYYKVNPQLRSADVMLKEWTIHQVAQQKCIKILVPNNEFPDSKPHFNGFGIDFEIPFEIHIDRGYWESFFGTWTIPQERDIIYFPLLNRLYEIQSTYVYRDFMQAALYFKVQLIKYQQRASTLLPDNIALELDNLTISTDELFEEEVEREIKRIVKPEQYVTITHAQDPTRSQVNRAMPIDKYDLYNHWTLVAETFYNLSDLYTSQGSVDAVIYRANSFMGINESRSFTFWFNPQSGSSVGQDRPLLVGRNSSNMGLNIDLVYSTTAGQSAIRLTMNSAVYLFLMDTVTLSSQWYGLVVNVSNQFGQAGVNLWGLVPGTTDLSLLFHKNIDIIPAVFDAAQGWKLTASPIYITNVRVFGRMIEDEKQNIVMNQMIVQDSDEALVIDNAKVLLRLPRIVNPK